MNKNQKTLIWVGAAVLFCLFACGVGYFAFNALGKQITQQIEQSDDPARVAAVAEKIAEFEIPAGYSAQMAMDFGMYRTLALVSDEDPGKPMIMLMGYNQSMGANTEQMQEQMKRSFEQQFNTPGMTWTNAEERKMTIRGQEVNVVIRDGQVGGQVTMRQLMTVFEGKNGTVLVMIQGNVESWDDEMINKFLTSIQ